MRDERSDFGEALRSRFAGGKRVSVHTCYAGEERKSFPGGSSHEEDGRRAFAGHRALRPFIVGRAPVGEVGAGGHPALGQVRHRLRIEQRVIGDDQRSVDGAGLESAPCGAQRVGAGNRSREGGTVAADLQVDREQGVHVVGKLLQHPERMHLREPPIPKAGAVVSLPRESADQVVPARAEPTGGGEQSGALESRIARRETGARHRLASDFQREEPDPVEEPVVAAGRGLVRNCAPQLACSRDHMRCGLDGVLPGEPQRHDALDRAAERRAPGAARNCCDHFRPPGCPSARQTFWPPKPNELERATSIVACRGCSPITGSGQSGSGSR